MSDACISNNTKRLDNLVLLDLRTFYTNRNFLIINLITEIFWTNRQAVAKTIVSKGRKKKIATDPTPSKKL